LHGDGIAGSTRAYGGSAIAGLIRKQELQQGRIPHALAFAVPRSQQRCCSPVWPATAVDSGSSGTYGGDIPMGQLIALPTDPYPVDPNDATKRINRLGLSPAGLAIAVAAYEYGLYDLDSSGGFAIYAEPGSEAHFNAYTVASDIDKIRAELRCVTNNRVDNVGGGVAGATRRAPLAPPIGGVTPPPPVVAPSGVTAVQQTGVLTVRVSWTDNTSDETGFAIERRTSAGAFAQIATVAANVRIYDNAGVVAGTSYGYRVRAVRSGTYSSYSNIASVTVATPPAPPTNLVLNPGFEANTAWPATSWQSQVWDGSVTFSVDTAQKHGGSRAAKLTMASASNGGTVSQVLTVTAGSAYNLAAWVRTSGTGGGWIGLQVDWYDNAWSLRGSAELAGTAATTAWKQLSGTTAAPSGATRAVVNVYAYVAGSAWIDDVSLAKK
jgi:hypothetical protein